MSATRDERYPMHITDRGVTYEVCSDAELEVVIADIEERAAQRIAIARGQLKWHPKDEPMPMWKRRAVGR